MTTSQELWDKTTPGQRQVAALLCAMGVPEATPTTIGGNVGFLGKGVFRTAYTYGSRHVVKFTNNASHDIDPVGDLGSSTRQLLHEAFLHRRGRHDDERWRTHTLPCLAWCWVSHYQMGVVVGLIFPRVTPMREMTRAEWARAGGSFDTEGRFRKAVGQLQLWDWHPGNICWYRGEWRLLDYGFMPNATRVGTAFETWLNAALDTLPLTAA